ncbi:MAG: hypothetical protein ABFD69_12665, partial [Candidatus Sumerlaeia bacterium]
VYGVGSSVGYTAGTGDVSLDPSYFDPYISDVRYRNNTLKTADSDGGPVGVNASYNDVENIVEGDTNPVNRAHGWTLMK